MGLNMGRGSHYAFGRDHAAAWLRLYDQLMIRQVRGTIWSHLRDISGSPPYVEYFEASVNTPDPDREQ